MAGDEYCRASLLGIVRQQVFEEYLTGGVEEVERFVEDYDLGLTEEGRNDAYLHLVTCREVADELLLSEYLAIGKAFKLCQALIDFGLTHTGNLAQKGKILLRCEEINKETLVYISTYMLFPCLTLCRVDSLSLLTSGRRDKVADRSFIGFEQVKE